MKTTRDFLRGFGRTLLVGIVLTAAGCSEHSVTSPRITPKQTYQDTEIRNLDFAVIRHVNATTLNGAITLQGRAAPSGRLQIRRTVRAARLDEAQRVAETIQVDVEMVGNGVVVTANYPNPPRGVEVQVDYDLDAPEDIALNLAAVNGTISVEGTCGPTTAHVTNGRVEVAPAARPGGAVTVTVVNGTLAADFPSGVAYDVKATTGNGCVVGGIGGTDVHECRTVTQVVHLGEQGGTPYDLRVVNGNIEVHQP